MPFTARHRKALVLRFGRLAAAIEPHGATQPETGCVGNGTTVPTVVQPPFAAMRHYGHVDRALHQLSRLHRLVLGQAYGDAGAIATVAGQHNGQRWRAVAPLTALAAAEGPPWVDRAFRPVRGHGRLEVGAMQSQRAALRGDGPVGPRAAVVAEAPFAGRPRRVKRPRTPEQLEAEETKPSLEYGQPAARWVMFLLDAEYEHDRQDREHLTRLEAEARALLEEAQDAFGRVYIPCVEDSDRGRPAGE